MRLIELKYGHCHADSRRLARILFTIYDVPNPLFTLPRSIGFGVAAPSFHPIRNMMWNVAGSSSLFSPSPYNSR